MIEEQHYERPQQIADRTEEWGDLEGQAASYEEICAGYGPEQQRVVENMERVWATRLLTFHMPLFFQCLFVPLLWVYFSWAVHHRRQWASKLTQGVYVSLPLVRPVWNLASWPPLYHALRWRLPSLAVCRSVQVPTRVALGGGVAPPGEVRCMWYSHGALTPGACVPALILHLHGGGFISSCPEAHEVYLRPWAQRTGCPILSVDYSLAPEYPYPTALNQAISVYEFLLSPEAPTCLGVRWDKILVTGDSAGGNLASALTLYRLQQGLAPPAGLVLVYPSMNRTPSARPPSSRAYQNDAMISRAVRQLYSSAYNGLAWDGAGQQWRCTDEWVDHPGEGYLVSPQEAPDDLVARFPPTYFICGDRDPLWSDTQVFYNRLVALSSQPVLCDILPHCTHGFLSLGSAMPHTFSRALTLTTQAFLQFIHDDHP